MTRKYDSSRRADAAQQTRDSIVATAFRLHGLGIFDMDVLAEEAGVSLATVRKYFPTREILYENCTAYATHTVSFPDVASIVSTLDAEGRTRLAVQQVYALYEEMGGQLWSGYQRRDESPALARAVAEAEAMLEQVAGIVIAAWPLEPAFTEEARGFTRGVLSVLTFHALRVEGELAPEQALERTTQALLGALTALSRSGREEAATV